MRDILNDRMFSQMAPGFGSTLLDIRLIEVQPIPIYGPARTHRKRRIQKKWLKRYGEKIIGYDRYLGDMILVDERTGAAYCHPDVATRLRYNQYLIDASQDGG
jgi:hypothetical protein